MFKGEEKRRIAEMVNSEGWKLAKEYLNMYAAVVQNELIGAQSREKVLENAYKFKFGTLSLHSFFADMEKIAEGLDKQE
jgi:hypothetical protein